MKLLFILFLLPALGYADDHFDSYDDTMCVSQIMYSQDIIGLYENVIDPYDFELIYLHLNTAKKIILNRQENRLTQQEKRFKDWH